MAGQSFGGGRGTFDASNGDSWYRSFKKFGSGGMPDDLTDTAWLQNPNMKSGSIANAFPLKPPIRVIRAIYEGVAFADAVVGFQSGSVTPRPIGESVSIGDAIVRLHGVVQAITEGSAPGGGLTAVQSNQVNAGSGPSGACAFASAQTAGDSNTVCFAGASFGTMIPATVTDTSGNIYTQQCVIDGGTGGQPTPFLWTATGIAAAAAGANTVTATVANSSFDMDYVVFIIEGGAASGVRVANSNSAGFSGNNATVSLAGTVAGDYVVAFLTAYDASSVGTPGTIGGNTANVLQSHNASENRTLVFDGISPGGTINVTATADPGSDAWFLEAVAFIPGTVAGFVFTDAVVRSETTGRNPTESITSPSDAISQSTVHGGGTPYTGSISESVSVSDSTSRTYDAVRAISESGAGIMPVPLQSWSNFVNGTGGPTLTAVPGSNLTPGSTIVVSVQQGNTDTVGVSDSVNGPYTLLDSVGSGGQVNTYILENNASSGKPTVTLTDSTGNLFFAWIVCIEIGSVSIASLDGHTAVLQSAPGGATDAISVGPPSPNNTSTPALLIAFSAPTSGANTAPNTGTGYSSYGTFVNLNGTGNVLQVETQSLTSASSAATFTALSGEGGVPYANAVIILDGLPGGFSTPTDSISQVVGTAYTKSVSESVSVSDSVSREYAANRSITEITHSVGDADILQSAAAPSPGGTTTNCVASLTGVTAGSAILVFLTDASTTTHPVSDNVNGSYGSPVTSKTFNDGIDHIVQTLVFPNSASGNITVTATGTFFFGAMVVFEIGGVTTNPVSASATNAQSAPGVGTDVLTLGPPSPNNVNPAFIVGGSGCLGSTTIVPTAGTGYTAYGTFGTTLIQTRTTLGPSSACTFSIPSDGTESYMQAEVIFDILITAATPTDAVVRQTVLGRAVPETLTTPSDSVVGANVDARAIAESVATPSDSVSQTTGGGGSTPYTGSISESIPSVVGADAVARAFIGARPLAETVTTPSDAVADAVAFSRAQTETVATPSDAVARFSADGRTAAESVATPSDSVSRSQALVRLLAENIPSVSDSASRADTAVRAVAESVASPSDAVAAVLAALRAVSETVTSFSDAVSRQAAYVRTPSESIASPSDTVSDLAGFLLALTESVGTPTDSVATQRGQARSIAESIPDISNADAVVRLFVGARLVTELATTPSDALNRLQVLARALSESVPTPSDSVATQGGQARALSESVPTPSDSASREFAGARALPETISTPADGVLRSGIDLRPVAETVTTPSDALSRAAAYSRSVAEAVSVSDSVSDLVAFVRVLVESVASPTDAANRALAARRALAEAVATPSDSVSDSSGSTRPITETVAAPSDTLLRQFVGARAAPEAVTTPSDAAARVDVSMRAIGEVVTTPSDAVVAQVSGGGSFFGSIPEAITSPADSLVRIDVGLRNATESVSTPADTVTDRAAFVRQTPESVSTPSDTPSRVPVLHRALAEVVTIPSDAVTRTAIYARILTELVSTPTDAIVSIQFALRSSAESVATPSDSVAHRDAYTRPLSETVPIPSDTLANVAVLTRVVPEAVATPADAVLDTLSASRSLSETLAVPADAIARLMAAGMFLSESIGSPTDSVSDVAHAVRVISESVATPSDSVSLIRVTLRAINESFSVPFDSVVRAGAGLRLIAESTLLISDAITRAVSLQRRISDGFAIPTDSVAHSTGEVTASGGWLQYAVLSAFSVSIGPRRAPGAATAGAQTTPPVAHSVDPTAPIPSALPVNQPVRGPSPVKRRS